MGDEARIRREVGRRPLPDVTDHLHAAVGAGAGGIRTDGAGAEVALAEVRRPCVGLVVAPRVAALAAGDRIPRCRLLPLGLGGEPLAGPAGVGVGLVPADVLHRLAIRERLVPPEPGARPVPGALAA